MKTILRVHSRTLALVMVWLVVLAVHAAVPNRIPYQGYLVDLDGNPLASAAPQNYEVEFRIFDSENGGDLKWAERQTITIDNGYFSVMLGNGVPLDNSTTDFLEALRGLDADNRYLAVSVSFSAGADFVQLTPRMRLLPAPMAFVAGAARQLVSEPIPFFGRQVPILVAEQDAETLEFKFGARVGALTASAISGSASGLSNLDASRLSSGSLSLASIPNLNANLITGELPAARLPETISAAKVTSGTFGVDRIPSLAATRISGTIPSARMPSIPTDRVTTGIFALNQIPALSTDRISGVLPVSQGGTGRSSFTADRILLGNGTAGWAVDDRLRAFWDTPTVLYVAAPDGSIRSDWPSGWGGGIATWDIVSHRWRMNASSKRSDARLKTHIRSLSERNVLEAMLALQPVSFEWINEHSGPGRQYGFIAQQVQQVLPELVEGDDILSVSYSDLAGLIVQAIHDQQVMIQEGEALLADRRRHIDDLRVYRDNLRSWLEGEGDPQ